LMVLPWFDRARRIAVSVRGMLASPLLFALKANKILGCQSTPSDRIGRGKVRKN
jgi:hypothetical protein